MEKKMIVNGNEMIIYCEDWRNIYVERKFSETISLL